MVKLHSVIRLDQTLLYHISLYDDIFLDNTAPVLKFTGDLPDNINNNKQRFTWSSSEYARFNCYIDTEDQPIKCGSGRRGSWTSNELADGQHTFRVRGTDEYGNEGSVIQHTWDIGTYIFNSIMR